jgi:8-oxo-dGTP pyrophosphatase MutT (NUDIX family)
VFFLRTQLKPRPFRVVVSLALITGVAHMSPVWERSAGVIPFLDGPVKACRSYLLIHSARVLNPLARWEFPKGTLGPGETQREAVGRALIEENGLQSWRVLDGFQQPITYQYFRDG